MKTCDCLKSLWTKVVVAGNLLVAATRSGQKIEKRKEKKENCILYSASDADRGYYRLDGYLSPIISPIQEYYKRQAYDAINLSYPLSYYHSREVRGGAILVNRRAIVIILIELAERIILGNSIGLQRKKHRRLHLLKNVLYIIKPDLIFAIQATHELCKAAHELHVAVVEPMHGMNLSPKDKIFRKTISGIDQEALPDAYLAYDDRTYATLSELIGERSIAVYRIPHPWHVECNDEDSVLIDRKLTSTLFSSSKLLKILVTLQWGYAGERDSLSNIIPNGVMHPALEQAVAENPDVLWLLRMHPVQLRARGYKKHRQYVKSLSERHPNVEWHDATELPLPMVLSQVQGHITMSSGATGEAAILGVPSLLLCPTLRKSGVNNGLFSELAENGIVEFGQLEPKCITDWISRLLTTKRKSPTKDWKEERRKFNMTLDKIIETYGNLGGAHG